MPNLAPVPASLRNAAHDLLACLRFFSRLPLPASPFDQNPHAAPDLSRLARMVPIAGAVIAAIGALALWLGHALGLPPLVCATLAISVLVLVAGALHEDGLADVADGFGGGKTRERKLEIMRDSRIGVYGAAALALSLVLRIAALSALLEHSLAAAAAGLILAAAASRAFGLLPLALLPPARADGLGASAGPLEASSALAAGMTALIVAGVLGLSALGLGRAILALALALAAAIAMTMVARRQIGGQTGDVIGATQQFAEIACLCGLLIGRSAA
ncbi:adenosylcobinamide-GDP ribazoletransferase [Methylocapsa sp. S129]|uniref:adenosylcobinamide-GDP ribazoletransferase n=1 Tax=Methylocapsa sp. S129 TaxID=1641869 RepID=UPI00131E4A5C|nr:adenosylcobinamide-GDP ribazoletransferase [Methylocapsa sp. S129]